MDDQHEPLDYKKLRWHLIDDVAIDDILCKLNDDELELIGDSLLAALNGGCDELFHRLFEHMIPNRIGNDRFGKWRMIKKTLEQRWGEPL